jgi:choline oxidase
MLLFGTAPIFNPELLPGSAMVEHAFCVLLYVAHPSSRGCVRLRSIDPADPPLVDPRMFSDRDRVDERTITRGIRVARRVAAQDALAPWVKRELGPGPMAETDPELFGYVQRVGGVQHPMGTCRIGDLDDPASVVDRSLRVCGLDALRVADASVFPAAIAQNINITCMMIGERCAEFSLRAMMR